MKKKTNLFSLWIVSGLILLANIPVFSQGPTLTRGDLVGYVYEKDGVIPVREAVVQLKKLPDGQIHASSVSDKEGMFEVRGIEKGVYLISVKTPVGSYKSGTLLGILVSADVTARMEIILRPDPFLSDPVGQVSIAAGNKAIFDGVVEIDDVPKEAGPFRIEFPE